MVCSSFQGVIKERQRLMIIELENYNSAEELSIEKGNTTSLGLIQHRCIVHELHTSCRLSSLSSFYKGFHLSQSFLRSRFLFLRLWPFLQKEGMQTGKP